MKSVKNLSFMVLTLFIVNLLSCSGGGALDEEFEKNYKKSRVRSILNSPITNTTTYIEKYINPTTYIQHNLSMPNGRQYLIDAIASGQMKDTQLTTWRVIADGDFALAHTDYLLNGVPRIAFDLYRFENDLIVEHWDNWQDKVEPTTSGRGAINGNTGIEELEKTQAYKALVERFTQEVLLSRKATDYVQYFREDDEYAQHTVLPITDGVAAFRTYIENIGNNLQHTRLHRILGEGNFVFTQSEGYLNGVHSAFYDLYRLYEGKIVEHWDVIESIPAQETWANSNGKF